MSFYANLTDADIVLELFEGIEGGIVVMDKDYVVRMINKAARNLIGKSPNCLSGHITCYDLFYDRKEVCDECPVCDGIVLGKHKSLIVKRDGEGDLFVKVFFSEWADHLVLTLHDVTHEVRLLRELDLGRRELQAKNVLVERRQRETLKEREYIEQLWNSLPDALITIDGWFSIEKRNTVAQEIMPVISATKCYELLGENEICKGCPVEAGLIGDESFKKSHKVDERYFTEIISRSPPPGKGGMLIFRDATRQIQLIERIREQQEAISRKNEILASLVSLSAKMHNESETELVLEFFLDLFQSVIRTRSLAFIVNDIRPGNIWLTGQREVSEEQMVVLARAYLSREIQSQRSEVVSKDSVPFVDTIQISLRGGNGQQVGIVVLEGKYEEIDSELLRLFTEPLGAYIHNQLLMRKLEEKASTDPMTGLYNRGYLEQALLEERQKLARLDIHHAVVVADVNRLKKANDEYGHEAGDNLILTVSRLFKEAARLTDIVARTGGDEFIILLTDCTDHNAGEFINRLNQQVFKDVFIEVGDGEQFPVLVSLGKAGSDKFDPSEMIKEADRLMYEAKEDYYKSQERYR
ncbi:MAG: sensor domain-containing diguanylate cyclase [Proteobacteria bacterium]|nr:sensor domain-containing diguanylate cyclase [Pseudomonadota bacterium]MBU1715083.1 sensor domain-containing diguanylate cyclase [Pseudomonadota bacterium]